MKKILIVVFLLISLPTYAQDKPIYQATVEKTWTVDDARQEAFKEAKPWVDVSQFSRVDPYLIENKQAINAAKVRIGNRIITVFDNGKYGVNEGGPITYYYEIDGSLYAVDFDLPGSYPLKSYKYVATNKWLSIIGVKSGDLYSVNLRVGPNEDFVFKPNGSLSAHWVGSKCYNADGSSCGTRTSFKEASR